MYILTELYYYFVLKEKAIKERLLIVLQEVSPNIACNKYRKFFKHLL